MFRKTLALLVRALAWTPAASGRTSFAWGCWRRSCGCCISPTGRRGEAAHRGWRCLQSLTWVNIWFITLVGVTYFSSAITEEKEERTLGLLRMADIGSGSILLGKWAPRVVGMLSLVAVQFPFTLLAITLGGVTQAQVERRVYGAVPAPACLWGPIRCSRRLLPQHRDSMPRGVHRPVSAVADSSSGRSAGRNARIRLLWIAAFGVSRAGSRGIGLLTDEPGSRDDVCGRTVPHPGRVVAGRELPSCSCCRG